MTHSRTPKQRTRQVMPGVVLRPAKREDDEFLLQLYASTRAEELAATGWDTAQREAFLRMQFQARKTSYDATYPEAQYEIILRNNERIGWWVVHRSPLKISLINVALLPEHCGAGIGSVLMSELLAEAAKVALPVRLFALQQSRAIQFYQRFGFRKCGEVEFYDQMEWNGAEELHPPQ